MHILDPRYLLDSWIGEWIERRVGPGGGEKGLASIRQAAVAEEQPFVESDELRGLIAAGTERGYLTFEEIASTLEEVEVTKEQVAELHSHWVEEGVDVIAADEVTASKESKGE